MSKDATKIGLNAIGKPYSSSYDPNYRLKHVTSTAHLRFPYWRVKFVGEELREREWRSRRQRSKPEGSKPKESAVAALTWKENMRKAEFTARAPIGGYYVLSPFLHCWNVDYCKKRGRTRQQLDFAYTLDEAKAIAEAHSGRR